MNLETHKIGRFDVRGEWTPELLPPLYELLERYESYLPGWCQIAFVRLDNELGEDATAACQLNFEYRHMIVMIPPKFFERSQPDRAESLVHELVHANQSHPFNIALDLLHEAIGDNELAFTVAKKHLMESLEGTVCDLTALLMRVENKEKAT